MLLPLLLLKLLMRTGMMRPTLFAERQIATVNVGMGLLVVGVTATLVSVLFSLGVLVDG